MESVATTSGVLRVTRVSAMTVGSDLSELLTERGRCKLVRAIADVLAHGEGRPSEVQLAAVPRLPASYMLTCLDGIVAIKPK